MSAKSLIHQAKLTEWASRLSDQKASGLSVSEWCEQNNVSQYQYFYWKRLLKETIVDQMLPEIVPISIPSVPTKPDTSEVACTTRASCTSFASNFTSTTCARIFINGITIELEASASESFIQTLIKAVRHA